MAASDRQELKFAMEEFNRACTTLSELAFERDLHRRYDIHHACSRCLHLGVRPNQSKFECRDCGYQINADLNGAKSVAARHDLVVMGRYFCEYPRKEVNRPEAVRSSEKKRQVRNLKPQAPSTARPRA